MTNSARAAFAAKRSPAKPLFQTVWLVIGLFLAAIPAEAGTVRVTTWNLEWFPNGKPQEAPPQEQERRIKAAADVLRQIDPDILLLEEVRDYDVCARLAEAIKPHTYRVAICSAFKEPFHAGPGKQQVAILAKDDAQAAWAEEWKSMAGVDPPRGFAFAWFKLHGADLGVYAVHLKSNLIMHGNHATETAKNIRKREVASEQVVGHMHDVVATKLPAIQTVIVGGDFNTNLDQPDFAAEKTIPTLTSAGFRNCMDGLPLVQRVTHPGNGRYPDATFDYLFVKGATPSPPRIVRSNASDHMPVTVEVTLNAQPTPPPTSVAVAAASSAPSSVPPSAPSAQVATVLTPLSVKIPYGQTVIPRGTKLEIVSRDTRTVRVKYLGQLQDIPIEATDVR